MSKKNKMSLLKLTWPIFLEILLFMMLGFVDIFVLSKVSDNASAAVSAANQIVYIVGITFTVISGAAAILIAQNLGAGNRNEASRVTAVSLISNLLMGIVISALLVIFSGEFLEFMKLDGDIMIQGKKYLVIVGAFLFSQGLLNTISAVLRSHGNTKITMMVSVFMNIMNIILDVALVLGWFGFPKMGVTGVALATSLSRVVGVVLLGIYLFKNYESIKILKIIVCFPWNLLKKIFKIGMQSAFEIVSYNIVQILITRMIFEHLGEDVFTTKAYVANIVMFFYIFALAISQGNQIIIGHLVGEEKLEEAEKVCVLSLKKALICSLVMSIIGIIFREHLIKIYTSNSEIIKLGSIILIVDLFVEFGRAFNLVIINGLRAAGDTMFPCIMAIVSMWGISALFAYILGIVLGYGLVGIWIAFAMDEIFRGICMLIRWKGGKWKGMSLVKKI